MARVKKSVLVPYSAAQMFELVLRIENYPQFLPWCGGATILERNGEETLARIDIDYHGVRAHFTTANREQRPERILIDLRDGPFRQLHGTWHFHALGEAGSKVELELEYAFATALLEQLIGPVFNHIAGNLVDAFVSRAEAVYRT
jgi:ribosome-associated toxin RatA of RatAB toxin-antitoxin module